MSGYQNKISEKQPVDSSVVFNSQKVVSISKREESSGNKQSSSANKRDSILSGVNKRCKSGSAGKSMMSLASHNFVLENDVGP